MRHSDEQINEAAERFEKLADRLDPATAKVEDAGSSLDRRGLPTRSVTLRPG